MSSWQVKLQEAAAKRISYDVRHFGFMRNFAMGVGMAWAVQREKYWHLPFIFLWASPYAGYQTFAHRETIVEWARKKLNA